MNTTWDTLNAKTASYRTLLGTPDNEKGEIRDIVFSGLHVKLSDVLAKQAPGTGKTLTIYADTLVMDKPSFNSASAVIVARSIDVQALKGGVIEVPTPQAGQASMATLLLQESAGGNPVLVPSKGGVAGSPASVPLSKGAAPQVVYYNVAEDGKGSLDIPSDKAQAAHLEDLLDKVWALNSLKASFTAATYLMDSGTAEDRRIARSMLTWVTGSIRSWGANNGSISSDFVELYNSAAALLVGLLTDEGAYYVPVLASGYYSGNIKTLLDTLGTYETHLDSLNVQTGLDLAIQNVSKAMQGAMSDSIAPLQTELDSIDNNIDGLLADTQVLNRQFHRQLLESDRDLKVLTTKIIQYQIYKQMETILTASFEILVAIGTAGASLSQLSKNPAAKLRQFRNAADYFLMKDSAGNMVSGLPAIIKGLKGVGEAAQAAYTIYGAATRDSDTPDKELLDRAISLMRMQQQSMASLMTGALLVTGSPDGAANLPEISDADRADPSLAWDNFLIQAQLLVKPLESIESSEVQTALAAFDGSLKTLAGYGKAINAKMVATAGQMSQGTLVRARVQAAENTRQRWEELDAKTKTDEEKLAALKGIIQVRLDGLKRSVMAAWTQYGNSFFYLNFQPPPRALNMDMDAGGFARAFTAVNQWIARLRGDTPDGRQVRLPDDEVKISFHLNIVQADGVGGPGTAVLQPAANGEPARITWTIQPADDQLKGILPQQGHVAIWIREAGFILKGVTPNSKGKVIAKVATSGSYENGFGPKDVYRFETKGLVGNYAYTVADESIYNRWKIDSEVYATPTPFTQWTFTVDPDGGDVSTATELRMDFVVAYSERGHLTRFAGQA
jgi:hypothetical protein